MASALADCGVGMGRRFSYLPPGQPRSEKASLAARAGTRRSRPRAQPGPFTILAASRGGDAGDWAEFIEHEEGAPRARRGTAHTTEGAGIRGQRQKAPAPMASPLEAVDAADAARTNLFASVAAVRSAISKAEAHPAELNATSASIRELLDMGTLDHSSGAASGAAAAGVQGGGMSVIGGSSAIYASTLIGNRGAGPNDVVETVPIVRVVFQVTLKVEFGDTVRLIGGHAALGGWDVKKSIQLFWSTGDLWKSEEVELPVNSIYVYKYVVSNATNPQNVKTWQQGNNQALLLSAQDQPLLHVLDTWRGDPGSAYTSAPDGSNRRQPSDRLTQVFLEREEEMSQLRGRVTSLSRELQVKSLEVTALRTEAKLSAKRRVDLQDALEIERSRVKDLTSRVGAWQVAFGRIKEKVRARLEAAEAPSSLPAPAGAALPSTPVAAAAAAAAAPAAPASESTGYASDYLRKKMEERLAFARAAAAATTAAATTASAAAAVQQKEAPPAASTGPAAPAAAVTDAERQAR